MPLISDSAISRTLLDDTERREPPARRLGILYISSLAAIAILSGISLEFAVREVNWQSLAYHSLSQSAQESLQVRELGGLASRLLAEDPPETRQGILGGLRNEIARWGANPRLVALRRAGLELGERDTSRVERAEARLRTALASAVKLVAALSNENGPIPSVDLLRPLVKTVNDESHGCVESTQGVLQDLERFATAHVERLRWLEFELFTFVMIVLLLEGLYVISPAVAKLQQIITEMERSHSELRTYSAKLERSNRELQDFASVASHDLQEPLRKVQAFSDRLVSKYAEALDEQGRDYLDRVRNAARRMQTLINDLLTYSRVTTNAVPFVPVDLTRATREVLSDLEARIESTGGRVEVAELPTIDADPLQVRQLLQNLIGNALKYHRPEAPPVVRIYGKSPDAESGGRFRLIVEDNGIGFDEAYAERIFGIFQRLHGRTEYEGTGVGLAVCRKIVERHGGTVTARSTPGLGSKFTVELPLRQPNGESYHERAA